MSEIVLVHGAALGGWCWKKVTPLLEEMGHEVSALDLPGHGADAFPPRDVTMADYAARVVQALDAASGPVVLVGHSMSGLVVSNAAEQRPAKVRVLVYVCAFLPRDGESLVGIEERNPKPSIPPNTIIAEDHKTGTLKDEAVIPLLFHDCHPADAEFGRANLCPQAVLPLVTPVSLSRERFGSVPRVYIQCDDDRVIPPALQEDMYTASPCQAVHTIHSGHSPFFSRPEDLASLIGRI